VSEGIKPRLGLIAGDGRLPLEVARSARAVGREVCAIGYPGITDPALEQEVDSLAWLSLGELTKLLSEFSQKRVSEAVMVGKVSKLHLYRDVEQHQPDQLARELIAGIGDLQDNSILVAIARLLRQEGVELLPQAQFCSTLVAPPGILGRSTPSRAQVEDIEFAWPVAKWLGEMDIGQSVVVESRAVLAVEAIEGTDAAVRRGGDLGSGSATLVKVARPGQDVRFDLPTIGPETVRVMIEAGVMALALEAHCTIILEREELLGIADANGIPIVVLGSDGRTDPVVFNRSNS
jgi:DUF1009 family protein